MRESFSPETDSVPFQIQEFGIANVIFQVVGRIGHDQFVNIPDSGHVGDAVALKEGHGICKGPSLKMNAYVCKGIKPQYQ